MDAHKKFSDEQIKEIYYKEYIEQHIGGYSLAKKYRCDFYDDFKRLDLPRRNNQEKNRKYVCNSDYFNDIDTEEKAYWLGFVYADGYITQNNNSKAKRFGISIQESDSGHLEKFKVAINSNVPIHHYKVTQGYKVGAEYCRVILSDDRFAQNLISHGCVERKSNILKPPIGVPDKLIRHFIRGFMDGNGSITQNNTDYGYSYTIRLCSTDDILIWIMDYLIKNKILDHKYKLYKRKPEHIVSAFEFGGNYLVKKFLDYIYDDATVWLDRKYNRYLALNDLIHKRESNRIQHKCDICGNEDSSAYHVWRKGEYAGYTLCQRHYLQIRKYGEIIPDKKDYCEICGDTYGKMTRVGNRYPNYYGITLCNKHYGQLCIYGEIKDNTIGEHKNAV